MELDIVQMVAAASLADTCNFNEIVIESLAWMLRYFINAASTFHFEELSRGRLNYGLEKPEEKNLKILNRMIYTANSGLRNSK